MHLWPTMKLRNSFKAAYLKRLDTNTRRMKNEAAEREGLLNGQAETDETVKVVTEKNDESTSDRSQIWQCCELLLLILCCCTCFCCGACAEGEDDVNDQRRNLGSTLANN